MNRDTILSVLGNIPATEAEEQYHVAADIIDMAAWLTHPCLRQARRFNLPITMRI